MAPSLIETETIVHTTVKQANASSKPLKLSGALEGYESFDVTPTIGREFPNAKLADWLEAPNADDLIRDLAITIAERGVVFFRAQDGLTNDLQKKLVLRLGELTGRPKTSGLHIHPLMNSDRSLGGSDPEISTISSVQYKSYNFGGTRHGDLSQKKPFTEEWHSDIAFEPVPADFSSLRMVKLPKTGGDTMWASGYEVYDRISEPYQKFLEGLTASFEQPSFVNVAKRQGFSLYDKPRGAAENVGLDFKAIHPVVRTNPVTRWKSIFPIGSHVKHINGLTTDESTKLLGWFKDLLSQNHDLQVRFKWQNPNDFAIWDNRSAFHSATYDCEGLGERYGHRAVGLGEVPFFDPESVSRRDALAGRENN